MDLKLPKRKEVAIAPPVYKRALAFIIDIFFINFVLLIPFRPILMKMVPIESVSDYSAFMASSQADVGMLTMITVVMSLIALLYFVVFEYYISQTPGKMILGMKVLSEDKEKSIFRYLLRSLFVIPVFPIYLLWIIEPFYMAFNKENQRLLEKWSRTRVVQYISY